MRLFQFALLASASALAYNPGGTWKKDDAGNIVVDGDGNPIIIVNGNEQSVRTDTISRFGNEARENRIRAEQAEEKLKVFDGLDAAKAREALEKLQQIDQKKLIDAGEVERVKQEILSGVTGQLTEKDNTITTLQQRVNDMLLENAFSKSQFISNQVAVPPEMFKAVIGKNFKVEGDAVVPYDLAGNKVISKKNFGEIASLDEALEIIVDAYPHRDQILRAPNASGSGSDGNGGQRGAGNKMRRADFEALAPLEQARIAQKGEITIVD